MPSDRPAASRAEPDDLSDADVALVRDSHARIGPRGAALSVAFFGHLHERAPRLRRFFPPDDKDQRLLAKDLFDLVVGNLGAQLHLSWLLERMGRRGLLDAVVAADVAAVGGCLLAALAELDDAWAPEVERAWSRLYDWAASAVRRGAEHRRTLR